MPHKKQKYGKSMKTDRKPKRGGWSDMSDGYERHEYGYKEGFGDVGEKKYNKRAGWSDTHEGSDVRPHKYKNVGGNAGNKKKYSKRGGWSDHGVEHAYQDGGVVRNARMNALMDLKNKMSEMGGGSLVDSMNENAYKDGGVVKASVIAKDEKGLKKGLKKAAQMMGKFKDGGMKYEDGGIVGHESHDEYEENHSDRYEDLSREELLALLQNR